MFWKKRRDEKDERNSFRQRAESELKAAGYDALFSSQPGDPIPPNFSDLWLLWQATIAAKPSLILEYGSGYSTYLFARTLQKLGRGKVISVELGRQWRELSAARLDAETSPFAEFISPSPSVRIVSALVPGGGIDWYKKKSSVPRRIGMVTIAFPELYGLRPDFIFLDGPQASQVSGYVDSETNEPLAPIVSDPLVFEKAKPPAICVDGRREQCAFLDANLAADYRREIHEAQRFTFFYPR
ncbi:MAG: hypothetical protein HXY30_02610 [Pseudorhodoplanes sp.]|nr:hypothetical protein [Pseudorhodoplanes sp.]